MTHFTVIVVGDDVEKQVAPYDESIRVEPYRSYLDEDAIERMAKHYETTPDDTTLLASKMNDWYGDEGGVDEKGLYHVTRYNPQSEWDWYEIGGRWRGYFPTTDGQRKDSVLAGEVDWDAYFVQHPTGPVAIVADGNWQKQGKVGWFGYVDDSNEKAWVARVNTLLRSLGPDTPLTLLDCHI